MLKSFSLALALGIGSSAASAAAPLADLERTCIYFEKRVFGALGGERNDWLSLLAQSCNEALRGIDNADPAIPNADLAYLERLTELRTTIIQMNVDRFLNREAQHKLSIRRTVTASGEYLIATQIGVMSAYESWAEAQGIDTAAIQR